MVSVAHRVLLILSAALLLAVALLFLLAPDIFLNQLGIDSRERLVGVLRVGGTGMLAEAAAVTYALYLRNRVAIQVVTFMIVVHFVSETLVRTGSFLAGEAPSLVPAIPQAALAVGLLLVLRRGQSPDTAPQRAHEGTTG